MIPNERKLCSYRCAACGDFTFPELPPDPPVREMACHFCEGTTFVRDLTAEELIELHTLLAMWRQVPDPQAGEVRRMQIAAECRNRQLDALHVVWCDGGCESGVHRFDGLGPGAITQEIIDEAVRNTERLKRWWANRQSRERDEEERRG